MESFQCPKPVYKLLIAQSIQAIKAFATAIRSPSSTNPLILSLWKGIFLIALKEHHSWVTRIKSISGWKNPFLKAFTAIATFSADVRF